MRACDLCDSVQAIEVMKVESISILECTGCGHQFADLEDWAGHLEREYGDDYFSGGGAGYDNYLRDEKIFTARGKWYSKLVNDYATQFSGERRVLEVGCAAGFGLIGFREAGWNCEGIEPNLSMVTFARDKLGLGVFQSDIDTWSTHAGYDLVNLLQVLPHFPNPKKSLAKAASWLNARGMILIETWRRDSWTAKMTGKLWHEYNPPSVLHWFTLDELIRLGKSSGLTLVRHGRPAKYISKQHAKSLLLHQAERLPCASLFKKMIEFTPLPSQVRYPAEDLVWLLFQKQ
jgi:SAM-dependent methyltransferase